MFISLYPLCFIKKVSPMLSVNTSLSSINAQRKLTKSSNAMGVSFERLSSGLRVNGAKDDAAGLAINNRMTAQTRGIQKSIQNSTDWVSLLQTADGALGEMTNILQRIRELSVQSASDTNNDLDRASLNAEVKQLTAELDKIATTTQFNGLNLLNGEVKSSYMQLGANAGEDETFSIKKLDGQNLGRGIFGGPNQPVNVNVAFNNFAIESQGEIYNVRDSTAADDQLSTSLAQNSAIAKAAAFNSSSDQHGVIMTAGAARFVSTGTVTAATLDSDTYLEINDVKLSGFRIEDNDANGALTDAINSASDETGVIARLNGNGSLVLFAEDGRNIEFGVQGFGAAYVGQADNSTIVEGGRVEVISRTSFSFANNAVGAVSNDIALGGSSVTQNTVIIHASARPTIENYDISTRRNATTVLDVIEFAFADLNETRAMIGAQQNRLESTISNLEVAHENLSAAQSRIVDADFAYESADLARNQIIQQAGVSVLSQANQSLSIALSLLS